MIDPSAQPPTPPPAPPAIDREFPCAQCGAKLVFRPGTTALVCEHCTFRNEISSPATPIEELDFDSALAESQDRETVDDRIVCHCDSCGADVPMRSNITSQRCPFCDTPIVAQGRSRKIIRPRSLLPFAITAAQSRELFKRWLAGLWFAPSNLRTYAAVDGRLAGFYIPAWTYDARAVTAYTGQRGDDYWTTETYWTTINGRRTMSTRQVRRTRWSFAQGVVQNRFDDVLVPASNSVPADKQESIGRWDLKALVPYADEYLSGFETESYTVDLREGFGKARLIMEDRIRVTIRADIGGDHQRIDSMHPQYSDITFKHILLPIWIAAYRYAGRSYRFLVNARTGSVAGDRPYSWRKITALVLAIVAIAAIIGILIYVNR